MWHEQTCNACFHHVLNVAADDIKCAEFFQHQMHCLQMHLAVAYARTCHAEGELIAIAYYLIYFTLLCSEFAAGRVCSGEVGRIVHIALRAGIDDHQFARLYNLVMQMVMQCLAMLREDGRE